MSSELGELAASTATAGNDFYSQSSLNFEFLTASSLTLHSKPLLSAAGHAKSAESVKSAKAPTVKINSDSVEDIHGSTSGMHLFT